MIQHGSTELKLSPKVSAGKHAPVKRHGRLFLFFGVILPLLAVLFETKFHFCAKHFFDPFPSANHIVLFLLIPLSNFLAWLSGRMDLSRHYAFMALVSGMALGIGCLYALMFLPITPLSCLFTLALGFGLLGLAPLLSIPCSWLTGKTVCALSSRKMTYFDPHQVEHIGHLIILVMVVAVELPSTLTRINLGLAASPATAIQGVQWLRRWGNPEVMLRACYERSGRATDVLGSLYESSHPLAINDARAIYYKVTGKPFNSVPIPPAARATIQHAGLIDDPAGLNAGVEDEFDLDADIAGEAVSGVARGLSVSASGLSGRIDPDALVGDLNWSLAFSNTSKYDREARAKILLPPGAVVTRATLIVDNVEHDATIMVRSTARAVYRQNVAQRKDPLLVSTCGADQVLVQCFPVRPESTIGVRLSMVCPLALDDRENAALVLPTFEERNFQVDAPVKVDIKSARSLMAPGTELCASRSSQPAAPGAVAACPPACDGREPQAAGRAVDLPGAPSLFQLTGNLDAAQLARFGAIIHCERDRSCHAVFCRDLFAGGSPVIERFIREQTFPAPKKLFVVVDGSAPMQHYLKEVLEGLRALPPGLAARLTLVGDENLNLPPEPAKTGDPAWAKALESLAGFQAAGGQDDDVALRDALAAALSDAGSAVLWIHAAQPVDPAIKDAVKSLLSRAAARPLLYDLQVVSGPDEILGGTDARASLVRVGRTGSLSADMARLYKSWQSLSGGSGDGGGSSVSFGGALSEYRVLAEKDLDGIAAQPEAMSSLAQLYAYQRLLADLQSSVPQKDAEAYYLADQYHLVTPVSSAIVTETIPSLACDLKLPSKKAPDLLDKIAHPRRAVQAAFDKVTGQLNQLNQCSGGEGGGRALNGFDSGPGSSSTEELRKQSEMEPKSLPEMQCVLKEKCRRNDAALNRPTLMLGGQNAAEGDKFDAGKEDQRFRQAGESGQFAQPREEEKCADAVVASKDEENVAPADESAAAEEPKPVPEADTWLYVCVAGALTGMVILTGRRQKRLRKA